MSRYYLGDQLSRARLPSADCLANSLAKVVFAGNTECKREVEKVKKFLTVRREEVRTALEWLCANHLGFQYHGITVNTEVIDSLPENGVPQIILDRWTNSNDEDANAVESSGYVPEYPIFGVRTETTSETESCECSSCSSSSSSMTEDSGDEQSSNSSGSSSSTSKPPPDIDLTVSEPFPEVEIPLIPVAMMDVDCTEVHVQDLQEGAKENLRQSL